MNNYNIKDLRELSRSRGLKVSGTKSELILRLEKQRIMRSKKTGVKRKKQTDSCRLLVPKVNIRSSFQITASLPSLSTLQIMGYRFLPQIDLSRFIYSMVSLPINSIKTVIGSYRSYLSSRISYSSHNDNIVNTDCSISGTLFLKGSTEIMGGEAPESGALLNVATRSTAMIEYQQNNLTPDTVLKSFITTPISIIRMLFISFGWKY